MIKQLKLMLICATINVRPWIFISIQLLLLSFAVLLAHMWNPTSTKIIDGIVAIGMCNIYFGSFTTGVSCICTALSAESLRLPFTNIFMMLRTMFFMLSLCIAPYVLLLVMAHHEPYWFISVLFLLHSITLLALLTPAAISIPIYLLSILQVTRIGQVLHLQEHDQFSIFLASALAAIFYYLAWRRFKGISDSPAPTIRRMSFIELKNCGQINPVQAGNDIFSIYFSSDDSKRHYHPPKGNAAKAMRAIMFPRSSENRWILSTMLVFVVCAFAFTMSSHSIDHESVTSMMPPFAVMFVIFLIPALPIMELMKFFKKDSSILSELALLPGLTINSSLFRTLRLAISQPLLSAGTITFVLSGVTLLSMDISTTSILVISTLAAATAMALQILQYLFMFRYGPTSRGSAYGFNTLSFLIGCAKLTLGIIAMIIIERLVNSGGREVSITAPACLFALVASVLFSLGLRWYRYLKSLPHPFVTF